MVRKLVDGTLDWSASIGGCPHHVRQAELCNLFLGAFAAVAVTALAVGLIGFAYAFITIRSPADFEWVYLPTRVTDKVNFVRVGIVHNFTYLGGFLGILTACAYLVGVRRRLNRRLS